MPRLKMKIAMAVAMIMLMTNCKGDLKEDMETQEAYMAHIATQLEQKDAEQKAAFSSLEGKMSSLIAGVAKHAKENENFDMGPILIGMSSMLQNANQAGQGIGTEEVLKLAAFKAVNNLEDKASLEKAWANPVKRGQLMGYKIGE